MRLGQKRYSAHTKTLSAAILVSERGIQGDRDGGACGASDRARGFSSTRDKIT